MNLAKMITPPFVFLVALFSSMDFLRVLCASVVK